MSIEVYKSKIEILTNENAHYIQAYQNHKSEIDMYMSRIQEVQEKLREKMQKLQEGEMLIIAFDEIKKEREIRIEAQQRELDDKTKRLYDVEVKFAFAEV